MTGGGESEALRSAWDEQRRWSLAANRLKAGVDRARNIGLVLTAAGAVLGALAVQLENASDDVSRVFALLAAAAVGLVPVITKPANTDALSQWTRARSVSEGLKTEVYGYLAGSSRYKETDRDRVLRDRTRTIISSAEDLRGETATMTVETRALPEIDSIDSYVAKRVDAQVDGYYRPKAARYRTALVNLRRVEVALTVVGVLLGVAAGTGQIGAAAIWVPVATTLTAAVVAHTAAARYERMVLEYLRTADQLTFLRNGWRDEGMTESEFVDACEDVISVENQAWMARWNTAAT